MSQSQSPAMPDMYVLRVHFKNGTVGYWTFFDIGRAAKALDICRDAKVRGSMPMPQSQQAHCNIVDDAQRDVYLNGAEINYLQLVDMRKEVVMETRLAVFVGRLEADLKEMAGVKTDPSATRNGAIGSSPGSWDEPPPAPRRASFTT